MGNMLLPVSIRRSADSRKKSQSIVISLDDAVSSHDVHTRIREAEAQYRETVARCRNLVSEIDRHRPNPLLRWRLAETIEGFRSRMENRWRLTPTNLVTALARDLGLSESALSYVLRLRRRFTRKEVMESGLNWSKFQELLDIKSDDRMKQCFRMAKEGEIQRDAEIRAFRREANSR